jgi:ribosomal protein L16 Arg81 hydroxylase
MQLPPQEVPPQPVMSESVPPIAAQTDTTPMEILSTTEQDLWANFADALSARKVSLTEPARRLLRGYVHRAAEAPGTSANLSPAESALALLADELQKESGGQDVDDRKVSAALQRWCPRAPFC